MSAFFFQRINDHIQYLNRLQRALDKAEDFTCSTCHECKLGIWFDQEGKDEVAACGMDPQALAEPHAAFHDACFRALECRHAGDAAGERAAITEMYKHSNTLINLLMELDKAGQAKK